MALSSESFLLPINKISIFPSLLISIKILAKGSPTMLR
jgi:hypothetical protein